jgi:hypothetical protein
MFIKRFNEFHIAAPSRAIARFYASEPRGIAGYVRTLVAEFRMEQTMKAFRNFAICFAAVLALPCLARAQDTGYITGTVTDKSSAAVAGAQDPPNGADKLDRRLPRRWTSRRDLFRLG